MLCFVCVCVCVRVLMIQGYCHVMLPSHSPSLCSLNDNNGGYFAVLFVIKYSTHFLNPVKPDMPEKIFIHVHFSVFYLSVYKFSNI